MPLYLIRRPNNAALAEPLRNSAGLHSALISAASPAAAFSGTGWVTTDIATTPGGLHVDCIFDGDPINIRGIDRGGNPA